jgi:hypothetical protein
MTANNAFCMSSAQNEGVTPWFDSPNEGVTRFSPIVTFMKGTFTLWRCVGAVRDDDVSVELVVLGPLSIPTLTRRSASS